MNLVPRPIDTGILSAHVIGHLTAKSLVLRYHYSRALPGPAPRRGGVKAAMSPDADASSVLSLDFIPAPSSETDLLGTGGMGLFGTSSGYIPFV